MQLVEGKLGGARKPGFKPLLTAFSIHFECYRRLALWCKDKVRISLIRMIKGRIIGSIIVSDSVITKRRGVTTKIGGAC